MLLSYEPKARLHTPGHKGRLGGIYSHISQYDITELNVSGNLYETGNIISEAEAKAAEYFGVKNTFFSAGGATLCIQTALSLFRGKKVLFDRNSHISAYNASALNEITPVFLYNDISQIPLPISSENVEESLRTDREISCVFVTSPNYYGLCADIASIYKICRKYGVKLIIDNSHGSHLHIFTGDGCAEKNADIIIDSAHKTLPVLTGGAYLHINMDADKSDIKSKMRFFGSTSPSYPIIASLDYARAWLEENGKDEFFKALEKTDIVKNKLKNKNLTLTDDLFGGKYYLDILRVCILTNDGYGLSDWLEESGIIPEMASDNTVVMLFSPFTSKKEFEFIEHFIDSIGFYIDNYVRTENKIIQTRSKIKYSDAFFAPFEYTDIQKAEGRISAENITPYPPGVPILLAGEEINMEIKNKLISRGYKKIKTVME